MSTKGHRSMFGIHNGSRIVLPVAGVGFGRLWWFGAC